MPTNADESSTTTLTHTITNKEWAVTTTTTDVNKNDSTQRQKSHMLRNDVYKYLILICRRNMDATFSGVNAIELVAKQTSALSLSLSLALTWPRRMPSTSEGTQIYVFFCFFYCFIFFLFHLFSIFCLFAHFVLLGFVPRSFRSLV